MIISPNRYEKVHKEINPQTKKNIYWNPWHAHKFSSVASKWQQAVPHLTKISHVGMRERAHSAKWPLFLSTLLFWSWSGHWPPSPVSECSAARMEGRSHAGGPSEKPHLCKCWVGRVLLPSENCLYWVMFSCNVVCVDGGGEMRITWVTCVFSETCTPIWLISLSRNKTTENNSITQCAHILLISCCCCCYYYYYYFAWTQKV